jgi:hypothetical protein
VIESEAQQVDLQRFPFDRDFNAIDEGHADFVGRCPGEGQAFEVVMVGQGQQVDAVAGRPTGDRVRRQQAVRADGMTVKIAVQRGQA